MSPDSVCTEYVAGLLNDRRRVLGNGWLWKSAWTRFVPDHGRVIDHEGWKAADREVDRWTMAEGMVRRRWGVAVRDVVEASWLELDVDCHDAPWDLSWEELTPSRGRARRRLNAELARDRVLAVVEATPGVPWRFLATERGFHMRVRLTRAWPIERVEALGAALLANLDLPAVEAFPRRHCSGRLGYSLGIAPVKADLVSGVGGGAVEWMIAEMTGPKVAITTLERLVEAGKNGRKRTASRHPRTDRSTPRITRGKCKSPLGGRICVAEGGAGERADLGAPTETGESETYRFPGTGDLADQLFGADFASAVATIVRDGVPVGSGYVAAGKLMFACACAGLSEVDAERVADHVGATMPARRRKAWGVKCRDRWARARKGIESGALVPRLKSRVVLAALGFALGRNDLALEPVAAPRQRRPRASAERISAVRRAAAIERYNRAWRRREERDDELGPLVAFAELDQPWLRRKRRRPRNLVVGARLQAMTQPWKSGAAERDQSSGTQGFSWTPTAGPQPSSPTWTKPSFARRGGSTSARAGPCFDTS